MFKWVEMRNIQIKAKGKRRRERKRWLESEVNKANLSEGRRTEGHGEAGDLEDEAHFMDEEGWGHRSGGTVRRASSPLLQTIVSLRVISSPKMYVLGTYHAEGPSEALNRDSKYNCPNSYFYRETDDEQGNKDRLLGQEVISA